MCGRKLSISVLTGSWVKYVEYCIKANNNNVCGSFQKQQNLAYCEEDVMFFEHQLDLFGKLAFVRKFNKPQN